MRRIRDYGASGNLRVRLRAGAVALVAGLSLVVILGAGQRVVFAQGSSPATERQTAKADLAAVALTAKEALKMAWERARAWQADARLVTIAMAGADDKGKGCVAPGMTCTFKFASEKAPDVIRYVMMEKGRVRDEANESPATPGPAIPEAFVDTDAALTEAIKHGYEPMGVNMMELNFRSTKEKFSDPTWIVGHQMMPYYLVNAKTGKFVRRVDPFAP